MKNDLLIISPCKSILFSAILFFCAFSPCYALDVTLEWDPNSEPDLAGYQLYQSDTSGVYTFGPGNEINPTPILPSGGVTETYILENVPDGTWYWVVAAYDNEGLESDPSNEVCYQPITTDEDTPAEITLTGSDSLTYSVLAQPSHGTLSGTGQNLTYTPYADYNGSDSFTFKANDGQADIYTGTVSITVDPVNDAPVVSDIPNQSIAEGSTFTTISLDDYVEDVDNADSEITWTYTGNSELTVTIDANRVATITIPDIDWYGAETITFTATDPGLLSDSDDATFTVTAVNDAPVVSDIPNQSIAEGSTFTTISLDDYVDDVETGDAEIGWSFSGNVELTVSIANRVATITIPEENWNGSETITFTATDPSGLFAGDPAIFTVTPVNDAPTISGTPDTSVNEDTPYSFTPTASDVDVGDTLTFSIENKPSWASFDVNTGALTGTPANGDVGITTGIVITVTDNHGASASLAAFEIEVVNVCTDLRIQNTVDNLMPNVGDEVVFTIIVTNSDLSDATGVQAIDILPSGLSYVSDTSGGSYDPDTGIWNIGDLSANPPNNSVSLIITAEVNRVGEIVAIASVIDSELIDLDSSNNSSGLILNGGSQADLGIWKTVDNPSPNIGETITFTITVTDNGVDDATGVQVTDVLPADLIYQSHLPSQGTYAPDTGVWEVGSLDVGAGATLQLTVTADSTDEKISVASITHSDQIDPDRTNNESGAVINPDTLNHPSIADLAIQKTVNQSEVDVGDEVVFTLVVRNNGPDDTNNVQINDILPDGLSYVSDNSRRSYDSETGVWAIDTIPAASYVIMDIVAEVIDKQLQTNTASIDVDELYEFDPNNRNDSDEATVTGLAADISVEKSVDDSTPHVGANVVFTLTVTNNGPYDATDVEVADVLPAGLSYVSDNSGGSYDSGTGVWTVGDLANRVSATLDITATVNQSGDITNTATRTSSSPTDMNDANDSDDVTVNVPVDSDDDGMPDEWEIANGLNPLVDDSDQDSDEDGLANIGEYQNGTDPNNYDTDNDEMPDGWEVSYGLNPLIDDSDDDLDGDGYTSLEEYNAGTDPNAYTDNLTPYKPGLSSPTDGQTDVSLTPELQTETFSDPDAVDTHAQTEWQISKEGDFSLLLLDIASTSHLTSLTVPQSILDEGITYYWRVRFYDNSLAASDWSEIYLFTTLTTSNDTDSNGIPDDQEVDSTVDLDGDGTSDIEQSDIKCVKTAVGDGVIGVSFKDSTTVRSIESLESIDPDTISDTTNKPENIPLGLITFKLMVNNPGDTAELTLHLSGVTEESEEDLEDFLELAKWYKYDSINGWQDYSAYVTFDVDRKLVTLQLKDGDYGDADGTENGIIVDPSSPCTGLTTPEPAPTPSGGGGGGGGCFIATAAFGSR